MKKIKLLMLLICLSPVLSPAQDSKSDDTDFKNHEIRVGGLKLIAGPILETNYEYVFNRNSGAGISILFNLNTENEYPENFSVAPFYRFYFLNKQDYGANGFFVEGFGKVASGSEEDFNFTDASLGMSLGKKWINSSGFVFEALLGASRSLGGNSEYEVYFRGGLFVGYRF